MFLAWHEIQKNKLRFTLIMGVLILVSYLVFFLSGLANGLQDMNRGAIDKWDATAIVLTEESDKSLSQSSMMLADVEAVDANEIAVIGQINAIATNGEGKKNVSIFGINQDEFIMPAVTEGQAFMNANEVIANDSLKREGFKLGDELQLSSSDEVLTIVGFTNQARFIAAPVLYGDLATFQRIKFGEAAEINKERINGIVVRASDGVAIAQQDSLEVIEIETFVRSLPGYTEQNITLMLMIYFLFGISSVTVAIFFYVFTFTVQKISLFGVMKAQGISNRYFTSSVIAQTFILAAIGVTVGFVLTLVTGAFLPPAVPVAFNLTTMYLYGVVLIAIAIAGAVFSVFTIVKIDPLKAIGG